MRLSTCIYIYIYIKKPYGIKKSDGHRVSRVLVQGCMPFFKKTFIKKQAVVEIAVIVAEWLFSAFHRQIGSRTYTRKRKRSRKNELHATIMNLMTKV